MKRFVRGCIEVLSDLGRDPTGRKSSADNPILLLDAALLARHGYVFDLPWYVKKHEIQLSDDRSALTVAIDHFLSFALKSQDLTPGLWFAPKWYSQWHQHQITQPGPAGALNHFLRVGAAMGANPGPSFEVAHYANRYSGYNERMAKGTVENALEDYVRFGEAARYSPIHWFDEVWYVDQDPQLAKAIAAGEYASGFRHYLAIGSAERRDPGPIFSERRYLGANPDVALAVAAGDFCSGFDHFLHCGRFEGRSVGNETVSGRALTGAW